MSTASTLSTTRPVVTEAAAQSVDQALGRLHRAAGAVLQLFQAMAAQRHRVAAARGLLARRRAAQQVLDMARRYDRSQPSFASELRVAAYRGMDDEQG